MLNLFDAYVRHARVYPAILVSLPFIFTWYSFSPVLSGSLFINIGNYGLVIVVIVVLMSYVVRYFGLRIEPKLWKEWNGAPSTRFLRQDDSRLSNEVKQKLYNKIRIETDIELDEIESDEKIIQAFSIIRNTLRKKDKEGLWIKFNREYGFSRNLLGSRWFWTISAFCFSVFCLVAIKYFPDAKNSFIIGALLNIISGVAGITCGWVVFPDLTKKIADKYAEDAILSYLNI